MATPEQIPTDLTLEIGADLSPDRFIATARAFFGYVQEISQTSAPEGDLVGWTVKVREGSTLLAVDPSPSVPPAGSRVCRSHYLIWTQKNPAHRTAADVPAANPI